MKKICVLLIGIVLIAAFSGLSCNRTNENNKNKEAMQRIQPLPMSEMQDDWIQTLERIPGKGLKGAYFPTSVIGALMYNPKTMGPFLDYWVTSKLEMGFSVREQELVILRMGVHYNCNYVWKHHVPVAREFGVTESELEAIKKEILPDVFPARETALLMLTDEMVNHRTVGNEAWEKWSGELKPSECVDLVSLVSQYVFFALLNNTLELELEPPMADIPDL